jgi:cobyric acid synthase
VCILVKKVQNFNKFDVSYHSKEQDLEICADQLENETCNLIILSLHRTSMGDFNWFLRGLDATLKYYLYNPKSEFLICGDINIDHLYENNQLEQINSLLTVHYFTCTANFTTRIQNVFSTPIDNVCRWYNI